MQHETKTNKAFHESKKYFYGYLYHHAFSIAPSSWRNKNKHWYHADSVEEYKKRQAEEEAFLRISKNVFNETLPVTLGPCRKVNGYIGQTGRAPSSYQIDNWEAPIF
ncbi:MAG TPA: hypothetical protein DCF68_03175 [Cyanothece sp. UBA12306]|nr:hypothetical protein [Cyanothece sp. UBA12306]